MRIEAELEPHTENSASMIADAADVIFEDRGTTLRIIIQVVVAATIGMMLGAFGHSMLPF